MTRAVSDLNLPPGHAFPLLFFLTVGAIAETSGKTGFFVGDHSAGALSRTLQRHGDRAKRSAQEITPLTQGEPTAKTRTQNPSPGSPKTAHPSRPEMDRPRPLLTAP